MPWRALLADGRIVSDSDGQSPEAYVDSIVQFDVEHAGGRLSVKPDVGERVVWRRRVHQRMSGEQHVQEIVGLLNRDTGVGVLAAVRPDGVVQLGFVDPVEFSKVEVA